MPKIRITGIFRNTTRINNGCIKRLLETTRKAARKVGIEIIIPAGTAIQNGRSSFIGDHFAGMAAI